MGKAKKTERTERIHIWARPELKAAFEQMFKDYTVSSGFEKLVFDYLKDSIRNFKTDLEKYEDVKDTTADSKIVKLVAEKIKHYKREIDLYTGYLKDAFPDIVID